MHAVFSLKHWLKQALSPLGHFKAHSTEMLSQRSVQATFKSGTLKTFLKSQLGTLQYINSKTYKHSVNGSKSSAWHVTRVSMDIKKENLIFWNSLKHCAVLKGRHMRLSHGPPFRYAHHSSWKSFTITMCGTTCTDHVITDIQPTGKNCNETPLLKWLHPRYLKKEMLRLMHLQKT